ncbi:MULTISPECIES: hypothetical protein [Streptomyces]|uniref:ANTAR domain-containing protein n=1 Tax=Streptomyces xanthochromogenes TaxID=67384 RepID=A0ABQ3AR01_9ACTN|nr:MULTISPECIES: hypothetical protein [Streptomyces]MYV90120.1 hypothetical protein [Streptomyces sp. SID1034]GGY61198.1 hypothetical protein GCM10010326_64980 [Streptomyces xanthochromogenes]
MTVHGMPQGYEDSVGAIRRRIRQSTEGPAGDLIRAAEILVQMARRSDISANPA